MQSLNNRSIRNVNPNKSALKWLLWGAAIITLLFWTNAHDPFNAPKSWGLSIVAFWLLGWVIFQSKGQWRNPVTKWTIILTLLFGSCLTISLLATDNKFIGFFGEYQRKTGYLTYLSLIIFFISAAFLFSHSKLKYLDNTSILIGLVSWAYGLVQHFGHDFVHWNNPYNSVLGTLGNPDFAAAVMAIFAILNFGIVLKPDRQSWQRLLAGLNVLFLFMVIQFAHVRQGIIIGSMGIGIIILVWIYQRNKLTSIIGAFLGIAFLILAVLGMLDKGPLIKYFYKTSVTYRGDYWRAGWRMFTSHPIFGVGLDRYGTYFRTYRDNTQAVRRGPNLVSTAAHNVPIQLASTGGALLLISYILLMLFIAWRGWLAIKNAKGNYQIAAATIVGAWVAYQAQSFISIDNIGIAIWGYILGGVVIGLSIIPIEERVKLKKDSHLQPVVSSLLAAILIVISALFFQIESAMHSVDQTGVPRNQSDINTYTNYLQKPLKYGFKEPTLGLALAGNAANAGNFAYAESQLRELIKSDSKYYEPHAMLAQIYEYQKNIAGAIEQRLVIKKLDPYNFENDARLKELEKISGQAK